MIRRREQVRRVAVFAANRGYALTNSRAELIGRLLEADWHVILATSDDAESRALAGRGAVVEPVVFNRGGLSPVSDARAYQRLSCIYERYQPRLVHNFHAKPVILSSVAARRRLGESVIIASTITGLGHAFVTGGLGAQLAGAGYRWALPCTDATVFQNRDDQEIFLNRGWVTPEQSRLVVGSGIDIHRFATVSRDASSRPGLTVVMLGRLLNQKGIPEFVEVAGRIRQRWPAARFVWAGEPDDIHPDSVSADWMYAQSHVEYAGRLKDVIPLLREADLLLFPSYREGVPRVVMEAAATGLPTVAFDVPGVREAVRHGKTGYLVPYRDLDGLTNCVEALLADRTTRVKMGQAARALAAEAFDRKVIEEQHLALYRDLGVEV